MKDVFKRLGPAVLLAAALLSLTACAGQSAHPQVSQGNEAESLAKPSLASLEAAYKRNSDSADAAQKYAQGLRENNRLQRAAIVLEPFIQSGSTPTTGILSEYGAVQAAMSNYAEAEKYAHKALAMNPDNGQAYHVLGIALDAEGKHDKAEDAFRKALDHWKGDPSPVLNNLGLNLAAQGFLDEAVETLRKASADNPDSLEITRNLRIVKAMQAQSPQPKPVPVPPPKPSQG
jgi:Flp pilus assembly protein TadD